jgi:predicted glycoside hydrolase/deacetylase ChbG (UPF0249 family)
MRDVAVTTDESTLVVNADDFGLSEGINRGIIDAFLAGAVTSASIMVCMPAFHDAVRRASDAGRSLGIGLHLTLTAGHPLTRATSLTDGDTGAFFGLKALLARAFMGRVRPRDVEEECAAQIARAREAGLQLTHLDGHHHVHVAPGIHAAVRRVVEAERIPVVRRPLERLIGVPGWTRRLPERVLIRALARAGNPHPSRTSTTDYFVGSTLLGARDFRARLIRVLDRLPRGTTELMVHPGYVSAPLPGADPYTRQREVELRGLVSSDVLERLHSARIRLANFGQIARAPSSAVRWS